MKHLLLIATLLFSIQSFGKTSETIVMENPIKIAELLTLYPAFSNQIFAQGAAFGFTPMVSEVMAQFTETAQGGFVDCEITLTAQLVQAPSKEAAPKGVVMPVQSYYEEGPCQSVMSSKVYDI